MSAREVALDGGSPWGFRIHGGQDVGSPLKVSRVNPGSKAALKGIREGDVISSINGTSTKNLKNSEAHTLLKNAGHELRLTLNEDGLLSPRRRVKHTSTLSHQKIPSVEVVSRRIEVRKLEKDERDEEILGKSKLHIYFNNSQEIKEDDSRKLKKRNKFEDCKRCKFRNYDLLKEIEEDLVLSKGFLLQKGDYSENMPSTISFSPTFKATAPRPGVWSPAQRASEEKIVVKEESEERKKLEDEPIPPVWTPKSAQASPVLEKKEFRPVSFESPTLPRKKYIQDDKRESSVPPPWQQPGGDKPPELAKSSSSPLLSLPKAPNPTVTLLQKAREGHLPRGAHYLNREMKEAPDDVIIEKLVSVSSKSEVDPLRKVEIGPKKIIGIGPTTKEGIPLVLRSEVTDDNREKWYKRMYDSLHKYGKDDDYVTVKYRTSPSRQGVFSYQKGSNSGYQSEPESLNYTRSTNKCITLDRRRPEKDKENDFVAVTLPRSQVSPPRRDFREYKNQPGRIEDYEPGHSSISELEANKWWDEVLEIFDKGERKERPVFKVTSPRSFTQYASGYISDPQYVYKRAEDEVQSPPSSEEQKETYRIIQKGGEIPLKGLRKPAPERPKEFLKRSQIEYLPLSPTLTKIRVHKQNISHLSNPPFYLHPACFQNSTLSCQSFPVGVCNSYSQIQIFSPLVSSGTVLQGGNLNKPNPKDLDLSKVNNKFSVQLQNISGTHEYVQIVPQPRNISKTTPIYANIPDFSSWSCYPNQNTLQTKVKTSKEKENSPEEVKNTKKHTQDTIYSNYTTFSDLKRVAPSIADCGITLERKPSKASETVSKYPSTKPQKSFISKLPSRKNPSITVSNNSKKVIKKTVESKLPKKERKKVVENEIKKVVKDSVSDKAFKEKVCTRSSKSCAKVSKQSERKKVGCKKEEPELKRKSSLSCKRKGDFVECETNLRLFKGSKESKSPVSVGTSESEGVTVMSPIYESLDDAMRAKPNVEDDITERFRSRSFSPDVRRKMFKLPDMNKPLPPKKKQPKNATLKMWSKMMVSYPNHRSRSDAFDSNVKYLRDRIKRKLAEDADSKGQFGDDVDAGRTIKKERSSVSSLKTNKYLRLNRSMPLSSIKVPSSVQKDEAKSKVPVEITRSKRSSESGTTSSGTSKQKQLDAFVKSSTTYSVRNSSRQEEDKKKSVKVTVAISSKAKEVLKKTASASTFQKKPATLKSSSPASSCRSGFSEKSERSRKESPTSSVRTAQSPSRVVSPYSSTGRVSSSSRSLSPSSTASRTKTPLTTKHSVTKKSSLPVVSKTRQTTAKVSPKTTTAKYKNIVAHSSTVVESPSNLLSVNVFSSSENSVCKERKLEPKLSSERKIDKSELTEGTNLVRTDSFFQNLFLRNSRDRIAVSEKEKLPTVLDRARRYEWRISWPDTYKSEPSLSLVTFYLNQKRPVSHSKFRSLDRSRSSPRSVSPLGDFHSESFQMKLHRFDSVSQFGDVSFEDVSSGMKERSSSEPPLPRRFSSDQKHIEKLSTGSSTPCSFRSLSCHRTQSYKPSTDSNLKKITVRARSAGTLEPRKSKVDFHPESWSKSISSLNLSNYSDHLEYQAYVLELMHSRRKCERFRELHKFYSNLERMGQLEETASVGDLRPRPKSEEVIDFDCWKKIRTQERAEAELKNLVDSLVKVQKEKDLLFRASDVEAVRWKGDRGLRIKERSVEDLKEQFSKHSIQPEPRILRKHEIEAQRDRLSWRGSQVTEPTSISCHSFLSKEKISGEESSRMSGRIGKEYGYSLKAWKNLSNEEVNNLIEGTSGSPGDSKKDFEERCDNYYGRYEILVPENDKIKSAGESSLHVRCNSAMSKSQTFTPVVKRKEEQLKAWKKSESVTELPVCGEVEEKVAVSKRFSSLLRSKSAPSSKPMSESEKKRLSMNLSREVIEKMSKASGKGPLFPRETLGALAAVGSKVQAAKKSEDLPVRYEKTEDIRSWSMSGLESCNLTKTLSTTELESKSGSSETSVRTVVAKTPMDVLKKVQYFEELNHSSNEMFEEEETRRTEKSKDFVLKDQSEYSSSKKSTVNKKSIISSSLENLKDYFGQQKQYSTYSTQNKIVKKPWKKVGESPCEVFSGTDEVYEIKKILDRKNFDYIPSPAEHRLMTVGSSNDSLFSGRSRSISPDPTKYYRAYLKMVKCGAVKKLRNKFESWEDLLSMSSDKDFWLPPPPRRFSSDPELTRDLLRRFGTDPTRVTVRGHEVGDVRWLKSKFEKGIDRNKNRGRSRSPRSPLPRSPITVGDRFMPRINVISKTAELQMQGFDTCRNPKIGYSKSKGSIASPEEYCSLIDYTKDHGGYYYTGEVEKLKRKFERLQKEKKLSILGQMYTSTPEVNELQNIAPYLECSWVAHKHPEISKTVSSPELHRKCKVFKKVSIKPRPSSSSPVRPKHLSSILKSSQKSGFADQKFDPSIHRPKYRYRPDCEQETRSRQGDTAWWTKPTVTFQESPRKYVESEVTIHYKSPIRSEAKEMLSEDELARRQAESMKRIYKEERRRKYLQELQDMNSRRHTDNFTPSQKSPISLNRYDDFPLDPSIMYSRARETSGEPVTVARGLYDFVGRRPRELAFRRGDIIFIIRKLDKHWCEGELNGVVGLFPLSYVEVLPHSEISMKFGRARAKYDFVPQTSMELSAQKGDVITLIRRIDENWFEGRIDDRTGIIPVSYCHVLAMPQTNRTSDRSEKLSKPVAAPAAHSLIHNGTGMSSKHYYSPYLSGVDSSNRSMTSSTLFDNRVTPEMLIDEALMQLDEEFDLKRTTAKPTTQNPSFRVNPRPEPALYQVLFNHTPNNDDELELIQGETVTVVEKCGDGWYIGSKTTDGKLGIFPGTHVRRLAPEFV